MHPVKTYQLTVNFSQNVKEEVKNWLVDHGIESFVEGSLDNLDIDHEFVQGERDFYGELGGDLTPLVVYSYQAEYLLSLQDNLRTAFLDQISCQLSSMDTSTWMEGWKDSFKPISTEMFYIYPPWEETTLADGRILLKIDPGMAFGTGQHATTQLCLKQMEALPPETWQGRKLLDVGTGSGILAIAAKKLGSSIVEACDIDIDAVAAAQENSRENSVTFTVWQGSLPSPRVHSNGQKGFYDVVIANILYVVLAKLIPQLADELRPGGLMILSGLLVEQRADMLRLARQQNLSPVQESELEGWLCLSLQKG